MKLEMLTVGQHLDALPIGSCAMRMTYDGNRWLCFAGAPNLSEAEKRHLLEGAVDLGFNVYEGTIFFTLRSGKQLAFDAPYQPRVVTENLEYREMNSGEGALMTLLVMDTATGVLQGIRPITLTYNFTDRLHKVCRELLSHGKLSQEEYDLAVSRVYQRYSTADLLARMTNDKTCRVREKA